MIANITYREHTASINLMGLNAQEIFATLVSALIAKHPFIGLNAFATNLNQIIDMIMEISPKDKEKETLRLYRSVKKRTALLLKFRKETDFLEQDIWDIILASEGMPRLRGFGFANKYSKEMLSGNSERISLTNKIKENN